MPAPNRQRAALESNRGVALLQAGRYDEAIAALRQAVRLDPRLAPAHGNLGQAYRYAGRLTEAIAASRAAIALQPSYREAHLNLAVAAIGLGDFPTARGAARRVLEIVPGDAQGECTLAFAEHALGEFGAAILACERAIAARPDYAAAHANLGMSLLLTGEFARGWPEYAWLRRLPEKRAFYPYLDRFPQWDGAPFPGRRLLVTREQGLGDAIQMARYLPLVKARGGHVALEVPPALADLLAETAADATYVVPDGAPPRDDVDLHVPILALPEIFGTDATNVPGPSPYLRADPARVAGWAPALATPARLRAGLVWAGNPGHVHDRERSAPLEALASLGAIPGVAWFSLQKGRDEDRTACGPLALTALGPHLADFADTAAVVAQLDLVVTVDTAVAHLAGALARPVWLLLPTVPDWRWLLERADSPWYPTMRLFRQRRPGDWAGVVAEVAEALGAHVAGGNRDASS